MTIDSVLLVSFGGPEGPDDIMAFLRNVTAGRDVPEARLAKVAEQYLAIGGRSPINDQARELMGALELELKRRDVDLPMYWGNRNWDPFLDEAVAQMTSDGRRHAAAFVTSAYSSYSSCRQYRENIAAAQMAAAGAPVINKIGQFYDRAGFIDPFIRGTKAALERLDDPNTALVFTAHSIPTAMSTHARYEAQLAYVAASIGNAFDNRYPWKVVFQSRSGSPQVPWLEPDVNDHLRELKASGVNNVVVAPIGFISDHVEVMFDLDLEARATAGELSMGFERVATPGTDPQFIAMVADLVCEELAGVNTNRCQGDQCCLAH